jgi:hypothetical protein
MLVSVITPSKNQGNYIEGRLRISRLFFLYSALNH